MTCSCNVCGNALETPIYESAEDSSITTMNILVPGRTRVFLCGHCGHLQTAELQDAADYYANVYAINLTSDDEDQLYKIVDGRPVYRADQQAEVLLSKLDLFDGCRILDYGCAKAPTLKKVVGRAPQIRPFLFDVTDKYQAFWQKFPGLAGWASHQTDPAWAGTMDVVLSFYALEHISSLQDAVANIKALLKPGGIFYFIVPNVQQSLSDFVVADHVNHFTEESLRYLLGAQGFDRVEVDARAHDAAYVVTARLGAAGAGKPVMPAPGAIAQLERAASEMSEYWSGVAARIQAFERSQPATAASAIYGAGFFGNFIAATLTSMSHVKCFIDRNAHLQGRQCLEREVVAPAALPAHVGHVYVGLNPRISRDAIGSISEWQDRQLEIFYL
ncbi:class I SAM-dependent methyltransferase [Cupriavidus necator]|uniref:class I SAM-dependent methyltransferase n=1 Tax=Cupriavidus necator TaxID=106590 RepID=UPI00068FA74F|nr:class I SAM-dependent methyltransferase [Cupriavidus necator]